MIEERHKTGRFSIPNFYVRRILRVWPVFFLVIGLGMCLALISPATFGLPERPVEKLWMYFLFCGNYDVMHMTMLGLQGVANDALRVTWSLAIEEQFYLLWPLLFFFTNKKFAAAVLALVLVCLALKFIKMYDRFYFFHSLSSFYFIALGAFTAFLAHRFKDKIQSIFRRWHFALNYAIVFLVVFFSPEIEAMAGGSRIVLEVTISFCYLVLILEQTVYQRPLVQASSVPLLAKLGRYTYGMYLYHQLIIYVWFALVSWEMTAVWEPFVYGIIILLITTAVGYASYELMEKRVLRLKDRFSKVVSGSGE